MLQPYPVGVHVLITTDHWLSSVSLCLPAEQTEKVNGGTCLSGTCLSGMSSSERRVTVSVMCSSSSIKSMPSVWREKAGACSFLFLGCRGSLKSCCCSGLTAKKATVCRTMGGPRAFCLMMRLSKNTTGTCNSKICYDLKCHGYNNQFVFFTEDAEELYHLPFRRQFILNRLRNDSRAC